MMRKLLCITAAIAMALSLSTAAMAQWYQGFTVGSNPGPSFNHIQVKIDNGSFIPSTGIGNFQVDSHDPSGAWITTDRWLQTSANESIVIADGDPVSELYFDLTIADPSPDELPIENWNPVILHCQFYDYQPDIGQTLKKNIDITYALVPAGDDPPSSHWIPSVVNDGTWTAGYLNSVPASVPEPGTLLAALTVLAPVGIMFRRQR